MRRLPWLQLFYWAVFTIGALGVAQHAKSQFDINFAVVLASASFPLAFFLIWFFGLITQHVTVETMDRHLKARTIRPETIWSELARKRLAERERQVRKSPEWTSAG